MATILSHASRPARLVALAALLAALFCVCPLPSQAASAAGGKLPVVVSIAPQKYFVERIGGERVTVTVMVAPGADPHVFEPRPQQMAALTGARLYFAMGVPFESVWLDKFRAAAPGMAVVATAEGIEPMPMSEEDAAHEEAEHAHGEAHGQEHGHGHGHDGELLDPHTWTSPPLVRIMAQNVRDALIAADPDGARAYHAGYAAFCADVARLDADFLALFSRPELAGGRFLTYHPAFAYFARAYGLTQVAVEEGGKEPGPRELAELIEHAREHGIKVVFVSPQFSDKSAKAVAREIGGSVAVIDPLAEDWLGNLRAVADRIAAGVR